MGFLDGDGLFLKGGVCRLGLCVLVMRLEEENQVQSGSDGC